MLLTVKRTLTIPFVAAVAVLPALSAHQAAHAATVSAAASASPAAAVAPAAKAARAAAAASGTADTDGAAATRRHHHRPRRLRAYIWAAHQRGKPYCWGGTSGCFDCSGLVMAAYRHVGLYFGRATANMLASTRLVRVSHRRAKKGNLAFYGTGHVELVAGRKYTLGALHSGTRIGWHRINRWWHPTMYFRIRHAG
jgi:cell wall-associated NlpC family hydrolase